MPLLGIVFVALVVGNCDPCGDGGRDDNWGKMQLGKTTTRQRRHSPGLPIPKRGLLFTWVLPLGVILGILALYVAAEERIYFYDPRGFQEVAINAAGAFRTGPHGFYAWLTAQSQGEYPPYWSLPLALLPPDVLNLRVPYEVAMGLLGLVPLTIFTTKIACRTFGLRVSPWMVLVAGLNPLAFLVCVQGVPDLIGMSLILAAVWILVSRPMRRSTLFWALVIGSMALLVKKNFLFDLTAVIACYLIAYAVAALRYRRPPERWRKLLKEALSPRVLLATAGAIAGIAVLTPGTLMSIFGRDNALFYVSYQTSLAEVLSSNLSNAGGIVALATAIAAVVSLAIVIGRRTSPTATRNAVMVASFLLVSELLWAIVQKQAGIIHQVHVWPLLMTLGFAGLVRLAPRLGPVVRQSVAITLAAALFLFMFAPVPALATLRVSASRLPAAIYPNVTEPVVQSNLGNLVTIATTVRALSASNGPVLVPIASHSFNSSLLYQTYAQQAGSPTPDIYQLPQVDLRDALPWSGLIGDDGRTVLVSQQWVPDLPDGHRNLEAVNAFLASPAAQRWIVSSQPLDAGVAGQLADLHVIHLVIPESDAEAFAEAIRPYLPDDPGRGLQGAVALLTDNDRRTEGPAAKTPSAWTTPVGPLFAPTRLLVNAAAAPSITLAVSGGCGALTYRWTTLESTAPASRHGDLDPAGASKPDMNGAPNPETNGGEGTLEPGSVQTLPVPVQQGHNEAWSQMLTLGIAGQERTGCEVTVQAPAA